jgi:hypothetical protein
MLTGHTFTLCAGDPSALITAAGVTAIIIAEGRTELIALPISLTALRRISGVFGAGV